MWTGVCQVDVFSFLETDKLAFPDNMLSPWTLFDAHSTGPTFDSAKQALSKNPWWSSHPEGTVGVSVGVTTEIRGSRCYRAAGENCRVCGGSAQVPDVEPKPAFPGQQRVLNPKETPPVGPA